MYDLNIKLDYNATKEYREIHEYKCDCAYCRNYYKVFKSEYPKTSAFIEEFGLDINFPLEAMPMPYDNKDKIMEYTVYYPVKGEMSNDVLDLNLEELDIRLFKGLDSNNPCPNPKMEEPYLLIEINGVKLPWVLDEDIE